MCFLGFFFSYFNPVISGKWLQIKVCRCNTRDINFGGGYGHLGMTKKEWASEHNCLHLEENFLGHKSMSSIPLS